MRKTLIICSLTLVLGLIAVPAFSQDFDGAKVKHSNSYCELKCEDEYDDCIYCGGYPCDWVHLDNCVYWLKACIEDCPCPASAIYGTDSAETQLLRFFRDNVLSKTLEGQELIELYYQWSPTIVSTMEADEEFKQEVKELIDGVLPLIRE